MPHEALGHLLQQAENCKETWLVRQNLQAEYSDDRQCCYAAETRQVAALTLVQTPGT